MFTSKKVLCWLGIVWVSLVAMATAHIYPMVIIPGNGGNQLEVKVNKPRPTGSGCPLHADWYRIWLDVWQMRPGKIACWAENMCLQYNMSSKQNSYQPGLAFRVPGFGQTSSIEYIDPSWSAWVAGNAGKYMSTLVEALVNMGYERGKSLRGAPFDFRFGPHSHSRYLRDLKNLIEQTYRDNGNSRVVLLAHSIGGIFGMYFLNQQSQQWKDRYIQSFVPISTPWKGTVLILNVFASGYNYEISLINPLVIRKQQRSYETNFMLLPKSDAWPDNYKLIETPTKNYTASDYQAFFRDIGYGTGFQILQNLLAPEYNFKYPNVRVHCFYGGEVHTPAKLKYASGFPDEQPSTVMGPGDGTVNAVSLEWCDKWRVNNEGEVVANYLPGEKHVEILDSAQLHQQLRDIITKKSFSLSRND